MERSPTFTLPELFFALGKIRVLWKRVPPRRVYFKQVYFSGLQSLPLVLLVGAATASILIMQVRNFGSSPKESIDILLNITLSELAPLLTAFLVTARSAPAMASELATMQANGEIRLLMRLGVPPLEYLIIPRVTAMSTSVLLLSLYFAFAATLAGSALAAGVHMFDALSLVAQSIEFGVVISCLLKSMLFGAAIALGSCYTGLSARGSYTEVPIAASKAVVRGLASVLIIDVVLVLLA
jgi:phospholipid/cholesterol/gamma-HCH transport system permease protein